MQRFLFNDPNIGMTVTEYLKHMICEHFQVGDIIDSFLWMPESLGGLGLKNPFRPLLLLRDALCEDPEKLMQEFLDDERESYETAKKTFKQSPEKERRKHFKEIFADKDDPDAETLISWEEDAQTLFSYEEHAQHRELVNPHPHDTYRKFLAQQEPERVGLSEQVKHALNFLGYAPEELGAEEEDQELRWTVQFLEDELFEKFGRVVADGGC